MANETGDTGLTEMGERTIFTELAFLTAFVVR